MSGHTPGPWRAVRGDDTVFIEVVNIAYVGVTGGDADNANFVVQAAPGSQGSLPHDACLIAASPELLDVVKRFLQRFELYAGENDIHAGHHDKALLDIGRSVIAKAEGK